MIIIIIIFVILANQSNMLCRYFLKHTLCLYKKPTFFRL